VILSIVAALLIVAAITLAFVWRHNETSRSSLDDARAAAVSAARQEIINLDSISAATIDADLTRTVAGATGSFKDLFTKSQADLKQLVLQRKTVSTATIRSAGVVRADTDTATVLVAVDRTLKDSTSKDGVIQHDRWKLDLELHGGRWLVANLVPVA
jgi:Mce-associated membrane protein